MSWPVPVAIAAALAATLFATAGISGCGGSGGSVAAGSSGFRGFESGPPGPPNPNDPNSPITGTYGTLEFDLDTTQQTYGPTDPVVLTLTLSNDGQTTESAVVNGAVYDLIVEDTARNDAVVWQYSKTPGATSGSLSLSIPPTGYDRMTYQVTWNQCDQQGNALPTGRYRLRGFMNAASIDGVAFTPASDLAKLHTNPRFFDVP